MANPQKENGATQIANEILEALINSGLNGTEMSVILFIIRKTYGWNKLSDQISLSQFEEHTPYTRPAICRALKKLQLVKVAKLVKIGDSKILANEWAFNKDYETWQLVKQAKLVKPVNPTSKASDSPTSIQSVPTKDTIQKTIQKTVIEAPSKISKEFFDNKNFEPYRTTLINSGMSSAVADSELEKFWDYWTEPNRSGTKQRWETEQTFDLPRRLKRWFNNIKNFNTNQTHYVA